MIKKYSIVLFFFVACFLATYTSASPQLHHYIKKPQIHGSFSSIGSDTLANLMSNWVKHFKEIYPRVNIQIQAAGSSTAPPALIESIADIGPMSRKMNDKELAEFKDQFGYEPTVIPVAIDALSVYVNKNNPIKGLTLAQVDAVFSSTRRCGYGKDIKQWQDLGMQGVLKNYKIRLVGRNSISGTYGYFKKKALCKGQYKKSLTEKPGSAAVVEDISLSISSIGYSGMGYKIPGVRIVPLSKKMGEAYFAANVANISAGQYPLSRYLYLYVNKKKGESLRPIIKEFITFVLSKQGQNYVVEDGYVALPVDIVNQSLAELKNISN